MLAGSPLRAQIYPKVPAQARTFTDTVRAVLNGNDFHGVLLTRGWELEYSPPKSARVNLDALSLRNFTGWTITCAEAAGVPYCEVEHSDMKDLKISKRNNSLRLVGGHLHAPGTSTSLTVDGKRFDSRSGLWSGSASVAPLAAMRRGKLATLRFAPYADGGYTERELSLEAFGLAMMLLDDLYGRFTSLR